MGYKSEYEISETINSRWDDGYVSTIEIVNVGEKPINDWHFYFCLDKEITNIWGAEIETEGSIGYDVRCFDWNSTIQPNESVQIGFTVNGQYSNGVEYPFLYENNIPDCKEEIETTDNNIPSLYLRKFVAKKIAKSILKNRTKLTNLIGKRFGSKTAVKFGEALKNLEGPLRKIANAESAAMSELEGVIRSALKAVGIKNATNMASYIVDAIGLGLDLFF